MDKEPAMPTGNHGKKAAKKDARKNARKSSVAVHWPQSKSDPIWLDRVDEKAGEKKFNGDQPSNFGKL